MVFSVREISLPAWELDMTFRRAHDLGGPSVVKDMGDAGRKVKAINSHLRLRLKPRLNQMLAMQNKRA